ncbi:MAG TPA: 16S rRNA (cytidine(1402)-2'-O)-methyltransferase [Bacteroidales bacterium]|nr:16S rRNA (cytidine(1402)-2'-O)-methyltransferase [Bacteroidales bacterium]
MDTRLYIVPTPIGNLGDITLRAIEVLRGVDLILAEDTRTSARLLSHYAITTPCQSYHQHNEHKVTDSLVERLRVGQRMALITDAGTPGISDPGFLLVRECLRQGLETECLPGATALIPALVVSGLPSDRFVFEGFLPHKKGRQTRLMQIASSPYSTILYESPHRVLKTLVQLSEHCGPDRLVSVSRELSKLHEETLRGSLSELIRHFEASPPRGEFVLVVSGNKE